MSNTRVYLVDGNTSFSMDIGREKETKEIYLVLSDRSFSGGSNGKESTCSVGDVVGSLGWEESPGLERVPWRREWQPTPVFLAGECPWTEEPGGLQCMGHKESQQEMKRGFISRRQEVSNCCSSDQHFLKYLI